MGADNEISVYYHEGVYYVSECQGGNVGPFGKRFTVKAEALLFAHELATRTFTEYGVRTHKFPAPPRRAKA